MSHFEMGPGIESIEPCSAIRELIVQYSMVNLVMELMELL